MTMKVPDDFASLHPIDTEHVKMDKKYEFSLSDYQPSYNRIARYMTMTSSYMTPIAFTNWRDEALAAQETCAISTGLNPTLAVRVKGPDAARFLKDATVNYIDKFPINSSKHGVMCAEDGNLVANGVLMRIGEDAYEAHWLSPALNMRFAQGNYDAELEDITNTRFLFQLIGPKSLEIVEEACQEDFHDLKMCRFRYGEICGKKVRVLRFGMTGGLAYEIHGDACDAKMIHKRLCEVGNKYGMRLLGMQAYTLSHTPGGSQQSTMHYMQDMPKELVDFMVDRGAEDADPGDQVQWGTIGSASDEPEALFMNPYELGLGKVIDYSHDFVGRDALLEYKKDPKRTMVTLKWDPEDLCDVYMSRFRDEEPYLQIDFPGQGNIVDNKLQVSFDRVLDAEGNEIGISGGRTESPYHQAMLSLASLDLAYTELGTEVYVLWGEPGTRQKKIRATVEKMPYNEHYSNRTFDVEQIPHLADKQ